MEKYENEETILEARKSYSKTDQDATFMRMKEDHMRNGKLKPGYNVQIGTENQFITGFSIHQRPGDTSTLKEHMEKLEKMHNGERTQQKYKTLGMMKKRTPFTAQKVKLLVLYRKVKRKVTTVMKAL